jgi:hypothetical protein
MKHASESTLKELSPLLERLRTFHELAEKRPGVFYRKSKAFLHFHEYPEGIFADVRLKLESPFARLPATTEAQQSVLLTEIERALRSTSESKTTAKRAP